MFKIQLEKLPRETIPKSGQRGEKLVKHKVKVVKLGREGHTECLMAWHEAFSVVAQNLDQGYFAYCEPDNIVISDRKELQGRNVEKVIIYAPVAGG